MVFGNKLLGGSLLIAGLTIGAGMLGLPVITALAGFWPSCALLVLCWLFMLVTGFVFLDVNLSVEEKNPNLISMAATTLGWWGKALSWVLSLLLLYSLTTAYIAGCAPLFTQAVQSLIGLAPPPWMASLAMPLLFGGFVYVGTRGVDRINRMAMVGLVLSYAALIAFIPGHSQSIYLHYQHTPALVIALTVLFTSFGYHAILPSLTAYLDRDRRLIRWAIAIGTAIPLLVYILWQWLIFSSVSPLELVMALQRGEPATVPLAKALHNSLVGVFAQSFSFFAIVTSFLGITLSLSHFLVDGLRIQKNQRLFSILLALGPPLLFVCLFQRGFYFALQYAGAIVAILSGILPACMAWTLKGEKYAFYQSWRGRLLLLSIIAVCLLVIATEGWNNQSRIDQWVAAFQENYPYNQIVKE